MIHRVREDINVSRRSPILRRLPILSHYRHIPPFALTPSLGILLIMLLAPSLWSVILLCISCNLLQDVFREVKSLRLPPSEALNLGGEKLQITPS